MKIKGYENYSIHEDGRVIRTYKNGKIKELKTFINNKGYKIIPLCKNGKRKNFLLHRLLAIHFIPNPQNKLTVDHENRDPLDNSLSNLRWYTRTEQNNNRGSIAKLPLSKGGIYKHSKYYRYQWYEDKVAKRKYFKTLELAQIFEIEHLEMYHLQS